MIGKWKKYQISNFLRRSHRGNWSSVPLAFHGDRADLHHPLAKTKSREQLIACLECKKCACFAPSTHIWNGEPPSSELPPAALPLESCTVRGTPRPCAAARTRNMYSPPGRSPTGLQDTALAALSPAFQHSAALLGCVALALVRGRPAVWCSALQAATCELVTHAILPCLQLTSFDLAPCKPQWCEASAGPEAWVWRREVRVAPAFAEIAAPAHFFRAWLLCSFFATVSNTVNLLIGAYGRACLVCLSAPTSHAPGRHSQAWHCWLSPSLWPTADGWV